MEPYSWALDRAAARELDLLEHHERRQIREELDALARHPFREGHLRYRDDSGFEVRVCFIGDIDLHYRVDHAVREIRVSVIERRPPLES